MVETFYRIQLLLQPSHKFRIDGCGVPRGFEPFDEFLRFEFAGFFERAEEVGGLFGEGGAEGVVDGGNGALGEVCGFEGGGGARGGGEGRAGGSRGGRAGAFVELRGGDGVGIGLALAFAGHCCGVECVERGELVARVRES